MIPLSLFEIVITWSPRHHLVLRVLVLGVPLPAPGMLGGCKRRAPQMANAQRTKDKSGSSFALKERRVFGAKLVDLLHQPNR
jgi:hypothetical protein